MKRPYVPPTDGPLDDVERALVRALRAIIGRQIREECAAAAGESPAPPSSGEAASPWLNIKEAAAYARRSHGTLRHAVKVGRLRAARVGERKQLLFRREYLDAWLEAQLTPAAPPAWRGGRS